MFAIVLVVFVTGKGVFQSLCCISSRPRSRSALTLSKTGEGFGWTGSVLVRSRQHARSKYGLQLTFLVSLFALSQTDGLHCICSSLSQGQEPACSYYRACLYHRAWSWYLFPVRSVALLPECKFPELLRAIAYCRLPFCRLQVSTIGARLDSSAA